MGKTIIQTIGPLYGEPINGTVFGRPNGSVYVPPVNTILVTLVESYRYIRNNGSNRVTLCSSTGSTPWTAKENHVNVVAQSQDNANYLAYEIASDSAFTDIISYQNVQAGLFNTANFAFTSSETIEAGTTYYLRCVLYASSGVPVATSATIELTGVVVS